ncbi:MAG: GNAT family N-acetyltransferase [Thermodesulfobacteriota bacterium]
MWKSGDLVTPETFDSLTSHWLESRYPSMWDCIFVSPPWLEVWWHEFGFEAELYLRAVRQGGTVIGIAPLLLRGAEASFIGSTDVCDYLDFIVVPGKEVEFFNLLLDDLKERSISRLDLRALRPDSTVLSHLIEIARDRKYEASCKVEDISLELDLPPTWEGYLGTLTQKQRHEVRRKLRRFREAGDANYRVIEDSESASESIPLFLGLFRESRQDKARFLTPRMESFFASLIKSMAQAGLLRLGILELHSTPVAAVICFDYHNTVFLYNNGYDPQYSLLSLGLVSKVLSIKDSIERGRGRFDFLKGDEEYKHRLGGKEVSLYGCQISLK